MEDKIFSGIDKNYETLISSSPLLGLNRMFRENVRNDPLPKESFKMSCRSWYDKGRWTIFPYNWPYESYSFLLKDCLRRKEEIRNLRSFGEASYLRPCGWCLFVTGPSFLLFNFLLSIYFVPDTRRLVRQSVFVLLCYSWDDIIFINCRVFVNASTSLEVGIKIDPLRTFLGVSSTTDLLKFLVLTFSLNHFRFSTRFVFCIETVLL